MEKNFIDWSQLKQHLHEDKETQFYPSAGEIWLAHIGLNIGHEIDGKTESCWRPVLVVKKLSPNMALVFPMTSVKKTGDYFFQIGRKSWVMIDQLRVIDRKRFIKKIGKINQKKFNRIKKLSAENLFGIKKGPREGSTALETRVIPEIRTDRSPQRERSTSQDLGKTHKKL